MRKWTSKHAVDIIVGAVMIITVAAILLPLAHDGITFPSNKTYTVQGVVQSITYDNGSKGLLGSFSYHEQAYVAVNNITYYVDGRTSVGNGDNIGYIGAAGWQNVTASHVGSMVKITWSPWKGVGNLVVIYKLEATQ